MKHPLALIVAAATTLLCTAAEIGPDVPFPDSFRSWQHVKSEFGGGKIFQFYGNPAAVEGYQTGKFPNGSILVRETLRAIQSEGDSTGMVKEGERTGVDVMVKDDHLYATTGGWGFETFDNKNARANANDRAKCYNCHSRQKDRDFVFTSLSVPAGTPYPEGYRHWTFLHSSMVPPTFSAFGKKPCEKPCMAGIFHFYANDKAIEGLRNGGTYSDGAIIAEEMLEWVSTTANSAKEGQRRIVGVMVKDSQRYGTTGGWGYGSFEGDSRTDKLDEKAHAACHQCHIARQAQGYVFTEYHER